MMPTFTHPYLLLLALAPVPAGAFYFFRMQKVSDRLCPFMSSADSPQGGFRRRALKLSLSIRLVCFALAWVFLSFAAANPSWGTRLVSTRKEGSSVMFVVDVSRSMTLGDVAPTRLSFASRYASLLIDRMPNTPSGVVLVKGDAILAMPVTADRRALGDLFESLSPALLTVPGSAPGKGVVAALRAFPQNSSQARTIVLFTDGDETDPSLDAAARAVRSADARLVIVGCGSVNGAGIRSYPNSDNPATHQSRLQEDALAKVASAAGNGSFYVAGSETGSALRVLEAVQSSAAQGARLVYSSEAVPRYAEFLFAALLFFCVGIVIGGVSWQRK